jgi:hypothetical protein
MAKQITIHPLKELRVLPHMGEFFFLNNRFLRERGMASNPKMEYQVFLCIFQNNSPMATLGLKEMGKFLWEGREKGLPWANFFPYLPKVIFPFPSNLR